MVLPVTRTFGLDHAAVYACPAGETAQHARCGIREILPAPHEHEVDDASRAGADR